MGQIRATRGDVTVRMKYSDILNCCGLLGLSNFCIDWNWDDYESSEAAVAKLSDSDIHSIYRELLQEIMHESNTKMLVAADTDTHGGWSEGYHDSHSTERLSLRGFCEYHGFVGSASIPRNGETNVVVFTLNCYDGTYGAEPLSTGGVVLTEERDV